MPIAIRSHLNFTCASHCTGAALAAVIVVLGSIYAWDSVVPVVDVDRLTVLTPEVRPGGTLLIGVEVSRYRQCPSTVYQWIFDGRDVQYAIAAFQVPPRPLGTDDLVLEVPIPAGAAPGEARYHLAYTHHCRVLNLWSSDHSATEPYVTFEIVPPPA